jgi:hypothetical protein
MERDKTAAPTKYLTDDDINRQNYRFIRTQEVCACTKEGRG